MSINQKNILPELLTKDSKVLIEQVKEDQRKKEELKKLKKKK